MPGPVPLTLVILNRRKKPSRPLLGDRELVVQRADLSVLSWQMDFLDLSADERGGEILWTSLGSELLQQHRDPRGILVIPGSDAPLAARDYASAVTECSAGGLWLPNLAREPGGRLVAAEESELPLPRFPKSRFVELYLVQPARAVRELELAAPPLRTLRLELVAVATPREVSAFYLPRLKEHGLKVKRRIWSSGNAERLSGRSDALDAVVHAEQRGPTECAIQVSWALKA